MLLTLLWDVWRPGDSVPRGATWILQRTVSRLRTFCSLFNSCGPCDAPRETPVQQKQTWSWCLFVFTLFVCLRLRRVIICHFVAFSDALFITPMWWITANGGELKFRHFSFLLIKFFCKINTSLSLFLTLSPFSTHFLLIKFPTVVDLLRFNPLNVRTGLLEHYLHSYWHTWARRHARTRLLLAQWSHESCSFPPRSSIQPPHLLVSHSSGCWREDIKHLKQIHEEDVLWMFRVTLKILVSLSVTHNENYLWQAQKHFFRLEEVVWNSAVWIYS